MAENAEKNDKMRERRKNLLQLFVCGIFIGIFLEIILLGGNKFHLGPSIGEFLLQLTEINLHEFYIKNNVFIFKI